jgi:hypothetical protein
MTPQQDSMAQPMEQISMLVDNQVSHQEVKRVELNQFKMLTLKEKKSSKEIRKR